MAMQLSKEEREKMMNLLPMSKAIEIEFTPEEFEGLPAEYTPVFRLTQMSESVVESVQISSLQEQERSSKKLKPETMVKNMKNAQEMMKSAVRSCVVGWSKLYDMSTEELVPYSDSAIDTLPKDTLSSIFLECCIISGLKERDEDEPSK